MRNFIGPDSVIDPVIEESTEATPEFRAVFLHKDLLRPEHFLLEQHQELLSFWASQRRIDGLPVSSAIDPLKFWRAVGTVMVLQPNADASDFFYRVHGSLVTSALGISLNQKWLSALDGSLRISYLNHYGEVCRSRRPAYSEHPAARERSLLVLFCRLTLPMVDENGHIDRLLISAVPLDQRGEPNGSV